MLEKADAKDKIYEDNIEKIKEEYPNVKFSPLILGLN